MAESVNIDSLRVVAEKLRETETPFKDRGDWRGLGVGAMAVCVESAVDEIERLRAAIAAIQKATVDGKVCDDVAWFDGITTLHYFCDMTLNPERKT